MANEKKRISLTVDAKFDEVLTKKAKAIGVPKSTLVAFATSLFLKQLQAEEELSPHANAIYSLIRENHDIVSDITGGVLYVKIIDKASLFYGYKKSASRRRHSG